MRFIERIRRELDITQADLSKRLGITQGAVSYMESRGDCLKLGMLAKLYKLSKLSGDDFMALIVREARTHSRDKAAHR